MMKANFILPCALLGIWLNSSAALISPEEALQRAYQYSDKVSSRSSLDNPVLSLTLDDGAGMPTIYIFENKAGYLILSADDRTLPVLGYSDEVSFIPGDIPPALTSWLNGYSRQIVYARTLPESPAVTRSGIELPEWEPIQPLIATTWDQDAPYNRYCPQVRNKPTMTGCVATSMSQVMNYFKYPEKGKGTVSYEWTSSDNSLSETLSLDLSQISFDWANMLDSYSGSYTEAQADAVATLMQAAGYSVNMNYGTSESGASSALIASALINNFGYDRGISYLSRDWYQYSDWAQMLYENLKTGPIIYNGDSLTTGHSFVCDGYNGDGYFHFNWGWSGIGNGFFLLDALSPAVLGIGGGASGGGYNFNQDAIFGIQPYKDGSKPSLPNLYFDGAVIGKVKNNQLTISVDEGYYGGTLLYQGPMDVIADIGFKFEIAADPSSSPLYIASDWSNVSFTTAMGYYINETQAPAVDLSKAKLLTGQKYKVTAVYKTLETDWTDILTEVGYPNYFYLSMQGVGSNKSYNVENVPVMELTFDSASLLSDLYYGSPAEYEVVITNTNDLELSKNITFCLLTETNSLEFYSDPFLVTLAPGETLNQTFTSALESQTEPVTQNTEYYLGVFDIITGTLLYKSPQKVTMMPAHAQAEFTGKVTIENANLTTDGNARIFTVENSSNMDITTEIYVSEGFFSYPVVLYLFRPSDKDDGTWSSVASFYYDSLLLLSAGETGSLTMKVSYPDAEPKTLYGLMAYAAIDYGMVNSEEYLSTFFMADNDTGIDGVNSGNPEIIFFHNRQLNRLSINTAEGLKSVSIYNTSGSLIHSQSFNNDKNAEINLGSHGNGILIVKATGVSGKTATIKLAL